MLVGLICIFAERPLLIRSLDDSYSIHCCTAFSSPDSDILSWILRCCIRLSPLLNRFWHFVHSYGLSSVCVRICRLRCSRRLNVFRHDWSGHMNAFHGSFGLPTSDIEPPDSAYSASCVDCEKVRFVPARGIGR